MATAELGQRFLNREPIPGVRFHHNDRVQITSGEHLGKIGWLVTVLQVDPEPKYILELESGSNVHVLQSQLRDADT
jgi:hypothetical protein